MKVVKTVRLFYVLYTVYTIFVMTVSNYRFIHVFWGLLFLWLTYLVFRTGFKSTRTKESLDIKIDEIGISTRDSFPLSSISYWPAWKYMLALVSSWACAILTAKFYTGNGFLLVIKSLLGGNSVYLSYQRYFAQSNIGRLSISKIPYIFMLAFLTIITIWSIIGILLSNRKVGFGRGSYLIGIALSYVYFGASRGTNFETYILFIVLAYCLLQKMGNILKGSNMKYFLLVVIAGIMLIFIYRNRIIARGVKFEYEICPEISFNENSIIAIIFPTLVNIGLSLFSYLGYGIYCMGVTLSDIWCGSISSFFELIIPFGHRIINGSTLSNTLANTIAMEARWTPDFVNLIDLTGIPQYFVVMFLLGRFWGKTNGLNAPAFLKHIVGVIIFIELLSIPVGNFLVASSSNEIMVLFAILWLVTYGRIRVTLGRVGRA